MKAINKFTIFYLLQLKLVTNIFLLIGISKKREKIYLFLQCNVKKLFEIRLKYFLILFFF